MGGILLNARLKRKPILPTTLGSRTTSPADDGGGGHLPPLRGPERAGQRLPLVAQARRRHAPARDRVPCSHRGRRSASRNGEQRPPRTSSGSRPPAAGASLTPSASS